MATSVGTVWVDVRFNTASLGRDLAGALGPAGAQAGAGAGAAAGAAINSTLGASLTRMGTSVGNLGRQVSLGLSLPLIAFGKVATDAFVGFDTAMTQVSSLVGINSNLVNAWRDDVLALGEAYGVSGEQAAQGLYFITSSGVEASDAMAVLDTSAKGAAIGLGTTAQVADVVTSAMNSYGKENITAAHAADVLTVAVREGKGEADQMAGALSRVIPLASSMGVSFEEVSGVMSALTLSGVSADEAATQINALLTSFQKMPANAQRSMKALTGLDYQTVQASLKNRGLTATLKDVYQAFEGNEDAIGKVFGNVRALRGITGLFGEKEAQTLSIVNQTTNAIGAQDRAMAKTAESASFRLAQSKTELSNAMTSIGASVVPVVSAVTKGFAMVFSLADAFGPAGKSALVFAGTVAAAAGPLLYMGSSVMRLAGNMADLGKKLRLTERFSEMAASSSGMARGVGQAGQAVQKFSKALLGAAGAAAVALVSIKATQSVIYEFEAQYAQLGEEGKEKNSQVKTWDELQKRISTANTGLAETNSELDALGQERSKEGIFSAFDIGLSKRIQEAMGAGRAYQVMGEDAAKAAEQAQAIAAKTGITKDAAVEWVLTQRSLNKEFKNGDEAMRAYEAAVASGDETTKKAILDTEKAKNSWSGIMAAVKDTSDAFFGVDAAQKAYRAAQERVTTAKEAVTTAERAHRDAIKGVADAQRKAVQADQAVIESANKVAEAKQAATDAQLALDEALRGPSEEERLDVRSAKLGVKEAQAAARKPGQTPLERERNQIALARARMDLKRAEAAHDERVVDLRKEVASATDGVRSAEQAQLDAVAAAAEARQAILDAEIKVRDTKNQIADAQRNVTQAEVDAIKPAMDLEQAQSDLAVMFQTGTVEGEKFRTYLTKLKELYPELTTELDKYLGRFDQWERDHPRDQPPPAPNAAVNALGGSITATEQRTPTPRSTPVPKGDMEYIPGVGMRPRRRAGGGPLAAGQLAQINERGVPELWTQGGKQYLLPTVSGHVTPQAVDASRNVGDIIVQGVDSPIATAYEVRRQLRTKQDMVGRR